MSVVVIVPNYNHARFLEQRLTSIFRQINYIKRIIILDDASSDDSLEIINKFNVDNVEIFVNNINSGSVFKQWEKGLKLVDHNSLVWIAESDDIAHEDFLKESLKAFNDPEVVINYVRSVDIDEAGEVIDLSYKNLNWVDHSFVKLGSIEVQDHLYRQCTIPNVSAVVFRKCFIENSIFNHNFKLCGDWYFYIRLLEKGKIAYLSKPLNFHRFHQGTMRNKSLKSLEILNERLLIVKEVRNRHGLNFYRYVSSAAFQIDLFITETRISDLAGPLGKKMFVTIKQYGYFFWLVTITLLTMRLLKKSFSLGR